MRRLRHLHIMTATTLLGLLWILVDSPSAQPTRVRGKSEQARIVARSAVPMGAMVTGRLESLLRVLKSDDPDWNDAQVYSVRFSDPEMRQNRTMRGQMIVTHTNGDRTFLEYEFTWKGGGLDTEFELNGRFVGGTGKFRGITGQWRERGTSTMTEDTSEWEIEYQRPGS
jgi:hypothetical protein